MPVVNLKIEDVAFGGKGVARENGKVIFVPLTIDGENVSAEIVRDRKKFAEADLVEVLQASPHRVEPTCPYFGRCGGCSYQHIDYEHQLGLKWRQVRDVLRRIGKLEDIPIRPIIASPHAYGYRNRVTLHVQEGVIGFFRRESHRLIDIEHCPISMDNVNVGIVALRRSNPRDGHYTVRADPSQARIFSQANDFVAQALRDLVIRIANEADAHGVLIDAYCGAGFFAKALRDRFERVVGIDWDRFAIEEAQKTAQPNESYTAGDVETGLSSLVSSLGNSARTLILDPPAAGLPPAVRRAVADLQPNLAIYVSCNPSTLARDLADLKGVLTVKSVTPLDMFPQTAEIEVAVHLTGPQSSL